MDAIQLIVNGVTIFTNVAAIPIQTNPVPPAPLPPTGDFYLQDISWPQGESSLIAPPQDQPADTVWVYRISESQLFGGKPAAYIQLYAQSLGATISVANIPGQVGVAQDPPGRDPVRNVSGFGGIKFCSHMMLESEYLQWQLYAYSKLSPPDAQGFYYINVAKHAGLGYNLFYTNK